MNKTFRHSLQIAVIFSLFVGCKKQENSEEMAIMMSDGKAISSSAAVDKPGSDRKFIRTADLKFKVKNVLNSTYAIENIANKFDGFVIYTNLQSNYRGSYKTKISQDSTLETTHYVVENNITIRVPNRQLDTVLKAIAKQINFLHFRTITAEDVTLQLNSNQKSQSRNAKAEDRLKKAITTKGKKLSDIVTAEDHLVSKEANKDSLANRNLTIQDKIDFSTITIAMYQDESIKQEMIANLQDYEYYKPNIGIRIVDAMKAGWYVLLDLIVFLIKIWWLLLLIGAAFVVYRKVRKKDDI
ncbi:DUF4349 domain-containing protein [Flavobacterium algicola]|uniref:DUF4349 domain-containing protein n=1 Tax=Flavobacterium algicola TaxID=556529 RepID=UPI001EFE9D3B|nr:DUF4349 domain-containing protein [Flavobacterium algicola]MCG9792976.1 DUF4349 domain-containing protein [Flavobacterium algicola]